MNTLSKVLVGAGVIASIIYLNEKRKNSTSDSCNAAPPEYKKWCSDNNNWLNHKIIEWKPTIRSSTLFGAIFPPLSYGGEMYQSNVDYSNLFLSYLDELNLDIIRIDLRYDIFINNDTQHIKIVDDVINNIKSKGYKLMLVNVGAKQYEDNPVLWSTYNHSISKIIGDLTTRYKPDFYEVIDEPITFSKGGNHEQISEQVSVDEWISFTDDISNTVKNINPQTKICIATTPYENEFSSKASDLTDVDIIGVNVYDTYSFDSGLVSQLLNNAKNKGKQAWITETWLDWKPSTGKFWKKDIDAKWITATVYYSQNNSINGYLIFYTKFLFGYSNVQLEELTPAYYTFKDMISKYK